MNINNLKQELLKHIENNGKSFMWFTVTDFKKKGYVEPMIIKAFEDLEITGEIFKIGNIYKITK